MKKTMVEVDEVEKYQTYYSEDGFWKKLASLAGKAGAKVARPALTLFYVLASKGVSVKDKGLIIGALGYLILPADLVPDFIVGVGFTDDFAALMAVLHVVQSNVDAEVEAKVEAKTVELFGSGIKSNAVGADEKVEG